MTDFQVGDVVRALEDHSNGDALQKGRTYVVTQIADDGDPVLDTDTDLTVGWSRNLLRLEYRPELPIYALPAQHVREGMEVLEHGTWCTVNSVREDVVTVEIGCKCPVGTSWRLPDALIAVRFPKQDPKRQSLIDCIHNLDELLDESADKTADAILAKFDVQEKVEA